MANALTIPSELVSERDFMRLYRMTLLGATDDHRREVDSLIALAFIAGSASGMRQITEAMRGEHIQRGQQS